MMLLEEIKKLRGLEQQAIPCKLKIYPSEDAEIDSLLLKQLHDLAPAMLEVLGGVREGDAAICQLMKEILSHVGEDSVISIRLKPGQDASEYIDCMNRFQQMAVLMEKEVQ